MVTSDTLSKRLRVQFQPVRDLCVGVCILLMLASWGTSVWVGAGVSAYGLLESALIFSILSETYARDE